MAATIRKFVKVKPFKADTQPGRNLNTIRLGVNRLGTLTDGIQASVKETATLIKFEKEYLKKDTKEDTKESKNEIREKKTIFERDRKKVKGLFKKKKRDQREKESELGEKEGEEEAKKQIRKQDKPIKGLLGFLGNLLGTVFKYFITFAAIDWLSDPKNGKRLEAVIKLLFTIGKFAYNITKLGVGLLFDGITNLVSAFQEGNAVSRVFNFFKGALQILGGVAALRTAQYMIMPWKVLKDIRLLRSLFSGVGEAQAEADHSEKVRRTGYRDKKTGVIYSEEEYKQMQKSAQRADAKRGAQAGKGMKSDLYSTEFENRFVSQMETKKKGPFQKMRQRGRIAGKKLNKGFGKVAGKLGGRLNVGMGVIGGAGRIASGLASGESAGKAVGAGVGQAAGGIIGGIAGTALLGPFLGPFAPIVGNAIGSFLGEWVGGELGPIMEPIFKPIQRYFGMVFDLLKSVFSPIIDSLGEVFSAFFDVVGELAGVLFKAAQILGEFVGFVLGPIFDGIGKVVNFVVSQAKRLMDPGSMAAGFFDAITFNLFDADGYNEKAAGGEVKAPPSRAAGGDTTYTDGATGMLRTTGGVLLNTMVGSFGMFGPAGGSVRQAMSGDIARLSQTFGVASGGAGSTGSASITRSGGTDVDFGSSSKEGEADRALQKSSAIHNKLISGFETFNKLLVNGIRVFNPEYMTEDSGGTTPKNAPANGQTPANGNAPGATPNVSGGFDEKFAAVLGNYEGLRLEAYADANYGWEIPTIGIGATYYPAGFRKSGKVQRGDTITEEEAYWIKAQHIVEHRQRLVNELGDASLYDKVPERVKVALESVVFNYGSMGGTLTAKVKDAISSGDYSQVSADYRNRLAKHNGGINSWRRNDEAGIIDSGTSQRVGISFAAEGGLIEMAEGGKIIKDVPYVNQRSLPADKYGTGGDAQCYSSTMSMWAQFLLGEKAENASIENYTDTREKYGISTLANSQQNALKDLGITAQGFFGGKTHDDMRKEIDKGNPVPIGFKYDHWALLVGYQGQDWIVSDPYGQLVGPPRGSFQKLNSRGEKTNGPGKYWKMSAKDMQHQNPDGDVWMWKTSNVNKNAQFGGTAKDAGGSDSGGNNANTDSQTSPAAKPKPVTVDSMVEGTVSGLKKLIEIFGGDASAFGETGAVTSDPDRGGDAPVDKRITPGAVTKTDETGATVKANPPGALAPGQRPDIALTSAQLKVSKKARKEADALGLTGMEKEKYVAGRVMGTIADPGLEAASNTRSAMVAKMRALDDKAKRQTDEELASPMILETPVPVPTPQAGSLNSGGGSTPVVIQTSPSPMLTGKQ